MNFHPPPDAPEIYVVGKQWMWKIQYPGGQRVILGQNSLDYARPSMGRGTSQASWSSRSASRSRSIVTSEDVIHDFGIPAFRQKIDAVPGRYVSTWYHPTRLGTYDIFCDQYCGTNHSLMVGKLVVVEPAEYQDWLAGTWRPDGSTGPGHRTRWTGRSPTRAGNCS